MFDNLLIDILNIQSPSRTEDRMIAFLRQYAVKMGYHCVEKDRNIYLTKGRTNLYPCFVAHTDTCASFIKNMHYGIFHDNHRTLFGVNKKTDKCTQVGFDDKVGIFIALQMMESLPYAKGFFPHSEEIGCVGSNNADMTFFDDVCYAIQCDRTGKDGITDEIGWVDVMSNDFKSAIKGTMAHHKRKYVTGMMTDVQSLKTNGLKVVCMNIECGYYNAHRDNDFVVVDEMYNTLQFVKDIVKDAGIVSFPHEYTDTYTYSGGGWGTGWTAGTRQPYWDEHSKCTWHPDGIWCDECKTQRYSNDYYPELDAFMCMLCYNAIVDPVRFKSFHK